MRRVFKKFFKSIKYLISILIMIALCRRGEIKVPTEILDSLARNFLPKIQRFFESEENMKEFERWKAEQTVQTSIDIQATQASSANHKKSA